MRRVVLVVLDGLRSDAIWKCGMEHLPELMIESAFTLDGDTVRPSLTSAALTSLFTGVAPAVHGIRDSRFAVPWGISRLTPLPWAVRRVGQPTTASIARIPPASRWLARRLGVHSGIDHLITEGEDAKGILNACSEAIVAQRGGMIFMHWPDADRAGHAHGWMSPEYRAAVRDLDLQVARLADLLRLVDDPGTLLVLMADHGGGGAARDHHDSSHPVDTTIPIILAGLEIEPGSITGAGLLDVPPTVLRWLKAPVPDSYAGRSLLPWDSAARPALTPLDA